MAGKVDPVNGSTKSGSIQTGSAPMQSATTLKSDLLNSLSFKSFKLKTKQQELLIRVSILLLVYVLAFITRLFSVLRYESMIHEFDPYFNYRTTLFLTQKGFYEFWILFLKFGSLFQQSLDVSNDSHWSSFFQTSNIQAFFHISCLNCPLR